MADARALDRLNVVVLVVGFTGGKEGKLCWEPNIVARTNFKEKIGLHIVYIYILLYDIYTYIYIYIHYIIDTYLYCIYLQPNIAVTTSIIPYQFLLQSTKNITRDSPLGVL